MIATSKFPVRGYEAHKGFSVIQADTDALKDCVYRLRYHVYVEVMQRKQIHADHGRRTICEPMDERGANYLAIKDGQLIGTVRRNLLDDPSTAYYAEFYQAHLFDMNRASKLAITTKLMMLPEYQGTKYSMRLIFDYAAEQYKDRIICDFIDCNDYLVEFFERLGYFSYVGWRDHKEYGRVRPMFYALDAVEYFQQIKSALGPVSAANCRDGEYGGYDLIRRLAREPTLDEIRRASAPYRQASRVDALPARV